MPERLSLREWHERVRRLEQGVVDLGYRLEIMRRDVEELREAGPPAEPEAPAEPEPDEPIPGQLELE